MPVAFSAPSLPHADAALAVGSSTDNIAGGDDVFAALLADAADAAGATATIAAAFVNSDATKIDGRDPATQTVRSAGDGMGEAADAAASAQGVLAVLQTLLPGMASPQAGAATVSDMANARKPVLVDPRAPVALQRDASTLIEALLPPAARVEPRDAGAAAEAKKSIRDAAAAVVRNDGLEQAIDASTATLRESSPGPQRSAATAQSPATVAPDTALANLAAAALQASAPSVRASSPPSAPPSAPRLTASVVPSASTDAASAPEAALVPMPATPPQREAAGDGSADQHEHEHSARLAQPAAPAGAAFAAPVHDKIVDVLAGPSTPQAVTARKPRDVADPAASASASAPRVISIATPALTPPWRQRVVQELAQLVVMRHDQAELHLNPAELGPIAVRVTMEGGQANLLLAASQPATRDALELALPQLRDTLAQQGITLGQTMVQDEHQRAFEPPQQQRVEASTADGASARGVAATASAPAAKRGLVDVFA